MAMDKKYGRVTVEHEGPGEDEPVIVFRATDVLLPSVMQFYYDRCASAGSPLHHLDLIRQSYGGIVAWQAEHQDQVRVPNSDRYAERVSQEA